MTKTVAARLEGDGLRLRAETGSGHTVVARDGAGEEHHGEVAVTGPREPFGLVHRVVAASGS